MKILLLGANGMLGQSIYKQFSKDINFVFIIEYMIHNINGLEIYYLPTELFL